MTGSTVKGFLATKLYIFANSISDAMIFKMPIMNSIIGHL